MKGCIGISSGSVGGWRDHRPPPGGAPQRHLTHSRPSATPGGRFPAVRLVIARCSVDYEGRLSAHLPEAVRLIMVKADGCVAVHADGGAYKPLNWMNAPNTLRDDGATWVVTNPKGETLTISFSE